MAKLTARDKAEILKQYACGYSACDIAKKFKVSHTAISKILKNVKSCKDVEEVAEKFQKSSREIRRDIIDKATVALHGKEFEKLAPETLLKIIERLSLLEPEKEHEESAVKVEIIIADCNDKSSNNP